MSEMVRARAKVRFLGEAEGGRNKPAFGGYSPNHNLFGPDNREMLMGRFELPSGEAMKPGETTEVCILFAGASELISELKPGKEWRVQEGGKLVAYGTILELLDSEP